MPASDEISVSPGRRQTNRLDPNKLKRLLVGMHPDGDGLYLRVLPSGTRHWVVRTVVRDDGNEARRTNIGLGPLESMSLAKARIAADDLRKAAREGRDPVAERKAARQPVAPKAVVTFEAYAEQFIEGRRASWKNAVHAAQWPATLKTYAYPVIGSTPIADVSPSQVKELMQPIWNTKPETAKKVAQRIGAVIDAAIAEELRTRANPTRGLKQLLGPQKATVEHHEALDWQKAPAFLTWLRTECPSAPFVRLALEWLALTGRLRWPRLSEQNFRKDRWSVCRGSSCRAERQRVEVGLIWCAPVKRRVRSATVVEVDVAAQ